MVGKVSSPISTQSKSSVPFIREHKGSFTQNTLHYLDAMVSLLVVFPAFSPSTLVSEPDCTSLSVLPRLCVTSPMILETISLVSDSTVLAATCLQESASNCDSWCVDERQLSVVTDEWRRLRSCGTGSWFTSSISADVRSHCGKWSYNNAECKGY